MLNQPCDMLPSIGPALAKKLDKCGISTISDLLFHLPYRYQDRTRITPIRDLRRDDWCVVAGQVCKVEVAQGKRKMLDCYIEDKTGVLKLRFFHFNRQQIIQFQESPIIRAFGEIKQFNNNNEIVHPEYQIIKDEHDLCVEEALTPIYSTTSGLSQNRIRELIKSAQRYAHDTLNSLEWMPSEFLSQQNLPIIAEAIATIHSPPPEIATHSFEDGSHPALKRLILEEFIAHQLSMRLAKQEREIHKAPILKYDSSLVQEFVTQLPFELTNAQQRVNIEIKNDLESIKPMHRLIQGDVGAGKTVIAAIAALQAVSNGYQVAFMAPTDLLSEQHAQTLTPWFEKINVPVHRLSGKMKTSARKNALNAIKSNECKIIIGTHALFQKSVEFANLGLVIIDEQHRFGVEQRMQLQNKGKVDSQIPHQLLMTATPIPRTLAMTQFAHLDLSIIDELPPGRTPVTTAVLNQDMREPIIERLQAAVNSGRQAYWVCPLIEESEKLQCIAATETAAQLKHQLPSIKIGLVHGRMKQDEKEQVMAAFKTGEIHLLVATTVIEVGVNVPNASLMIIENSERMGLSQLHQLRGRVGRGDTQSHCILLYQKPLSNHGAERLRVMRSTNDGFIIAETDLKLRGAGEVLGTRQTGYRQYKIADIQRDSYLLPLAQKIATNLINKQNETACLIVQRWLGKVEQFLRA